MNKDELWKLYCSKNPKFLQSGNVTLSAKGLKKLFDQTWKQAHDLGVANGRELERKSISFRTASPFDQFFGR